MVRAVFAVFLLGFPLSAFASGDGARAHVAKFFEPLRVAGWSIKDLGTPGLLQKGETIVIATTFYAGNIYKIAAAGCEDAAGISVAIFDEAGAAHGSDFGAGKVASLDFTPLWTGTFYIKLVMHKAGPSGAHYLMRYGSKSFEDADLRPVAALNRYDHRFPLRISYQGATVVRPP